MLLAMGTVGLAACGDGSECGGTVERGVTSPMRFGDDTEAWVYNNPLRSQVIIREGNPLFGAKLAVFDDDTTTAIVKGVAVSATGVGADEVTLTCPAIE